MKKYIKLIVGIILIALFVIWLQREIRWKLTRHEMDLMEHEILQQIIITDEEYMPMELIDGLYEAIMSENTPEQVEIEVVFDQFTQEFIDRINSYMNLTLTIEDLEYNGHAKKTHFEEYGVIVELASYYLKFNQIEIWYNYYVDGVVHKSFNKGEIWNNSVAIRNMDNESIGSVYNYWKNDNYVYPQITIEEYQRFMTLWEEGVLPKGTLITLENILNLPYEKYK